MSGSARKKRGWILWAALAVAVALCWLGWARTKPQAAPVAGQGAQVADSVLRPLLRDERLYQQAASLAALAQTPRERRLANQAQRLADEVMDASFAIAMERANELQPAKADAKDAARLKDAQASVRGDEQWLAELQSGKANAADAASEASALRIAQAQLTLDQARLHDASSDLARGSGDASLRIQQLQQEHLASHAPMAAATVTGGGGSGPGLNGALHRAWQTHSQAQQLAAAETAVRAAQAQMLATHNRLHDRFVAAEQQQAIEGVGVSQLHALTVQQRQISRLDHEADAAGELADTYHLWAPLALAQERQALHAVWLDGLEILAIMVALLVLLRLWERVLTHPRFDRRRSLTLKHLLSVVTELVALAVVLLIFFGQPPQTLTFLGLFGAGLTLAFQDTILSLAGWFALMSRHGVRAGDWVEINGVVGEVLEIRLLRTVLLETGNWITAGHPTGRRVFFPNSFALKGNYFNYSTGGQWMWDELAMSVPTGTNAQSAAKRVQQALESTLKLELESARADWQREPATMPATPEPTVHLRPNGSGVDLVVRYVTPARQRAEVRERIWHAIAAALPESGSAAAAV